MGIFNQILSWIFTYYTLTLLACLLFSFSFQRRSLFWVRLILSVIVGYALMLLAERIPSVAIGGHKFSFRFLIAYVICAVILTVCFKQNWKEICFCLVAGCLVQHATSQIYMLVVTLFKAGDVAIASKKLFEAGLSALLYPLAYLIFAKRMRSNMLPFIHKRKLVILALLMMLLVYFSSYFVHSTVSWSVSPEAYLFVNLYDFLICLLCLCIQFNIFTEAKLKEENSVLEELLVRQGKQQQLSRENVEMINVKCHDLKKQIEVIRKMGDVNTRERDELLGNLEREVMIYDRVAKTGNDALDIVLTEKSMYCEKHNIRFTYIVDNDKLSFLNAADVYSLFGNALENAIEYLETQPKSKRIVILHAVGKGEILSISFQNYCADTLEMKDGLPVSSKGDRLSHGFGLKSIRYIVEKYGGGMNVVAKNDVFAINIAIPISETK